jgi:hypothetical protein
VSDDPRDPCTAAVPALGPLCLLYACVMPLRCLPFPLSRWHPIVLLRELSAPAFWGTLVAVQRCLPFLCMLTLQAVRPLCLSYCCSLDPAERVPPGRYADIEVRLPLLNEFS